MFKKLIANFTPLSGKHATTCAIRQVLNFYGLRFSEELIFGLACGLNFNYFEYKGLPYPIISGRTRVRVFEEVFARNSRIAIQIHKTTSEQKAWKDLIDQIELDHPVVVYVDMGQMRYFDLPEDFYFGGHCVVVFGIDEQAGIVYLSDRDRIGQPITFSPEEKPREFHRVPIEQFNLARSSHIKPYSPENSWLEIDTSEFLFLSRNQIYAAIRENMYQYLNPPLKNTGLSAILYFSEETRKWENWSADKLQRAALNAFVKIDQIGGTGGGAFRSMYGAFLLESADLLSAPALGAIGEQYLVLSEDWNEVGRMLYTLYQGEQPGILVDIRNRLVRIANFEEGLANQLTRVISTTNG